MRFIGVWNAHLFKQRVVPEIEEQAKLEARSLAVIQYLRTMLIG